MESLLQKLVNKLLCNNCSRQLKPPLMKCLLGHYYCENCRKKSKNCTAECQSEIGTRKDYLLEKLCFTIMLNCRFTSAGCHFTGTGITVEYHERSCEFSGNRNIVNGGEHLVLDESNKDTRQNNLTQGSESKSHLATSKTYRCNLKGSPQQSIEEAILAELECPVCLTRISPPIFECANGHRICRQCLDRLKECPVCKGAKPVSTNILLEEIYSMLQMACRNIENGCDFYGSGQFILQHEKSCGFVSAFCPLMLAGMCKWQGVMSDISNHCRIKHSDKLYFTPSWSFCGKVPVDGRLRFSLFYVYGMLFYYAWQIRGIYFHFNVEHLGNEKTGQFKYVLKITRPGSRRGGTFSERPCVHSDDIDHNPFRGQSSIRLHSNYLLPFLDDDNRITHHVRIIKNSG